MEKQHRQQGRGRADGAHRVGEQRHPVYLDEWTLSRSEAVAGRCRQSDRVRVVRHQPAAPIALAR